MSGPQKKQLAVVETVIPTLSDKVVTIQSGTVKTSLYSAIYNLFKTGYDTMYTTASAVATQISNALLGYATETYVDNAANNAESNAILSSNGYTDNAIQTKINKQNVSFLINVDASTVTDINSSNCILVISNFTSGTGDKLVRLKIKDEVLMLGDAVITSLSYNGFDVSIKAWSITDDLGIVYLDLYFNVHSTPLQPIFVYLNKIN